MRRCFLLIAISSLLSLSPAEGRASTPSLCFDYLGGRRGKAARLEARVTEWFGGNVADRALNRLESFKALRPPLREFYPHGSELQWKAERQRHIAKNFVLVGERGTLRHVVALAELIAQASRGLDSMLEDGPAAELDPSLRPLAEWTQSRFELWGPAAVGTILRRYLRSPEGIRALTSTFLPARELKDFLGRYAPDVLGEVIDAFDRAGYRILAADLR